MAGLPGPCLRPLGGGPRGEASPGRQLGRVPPHAPAPGCVRAGPPGTLVNIQPLLFRDSQCLILPEQLAILQFHTHGLVHIYGAGVHIPIWQVRKLRLSGAVT